MKSKFIYLIILMFIERNIYAENIEMNADIITLDKINQTTVFENNVVIKDQDGTVIKSNFAEYNKNKNTIYLKDKIIINDNNKNILKSNEATFNRNLKILKTLGKTSFFSSEGYKLVSSDITIDNNKKLIFSKKPSQISDLEGNSIDLENFEYMSLEKIFKSVGRIKLDDHKKNSYLFSQLIIDTEKKEMIGTDIKAYLNDEQFKADKRNKPRIFANSMQIKDQNTSFQNSSMTFCDYRSNDKCPPWQMLAKNMSHNEKNKTIYYDNVVLKIYNIPVLYFPYFFHPDPSVDRKSGFLIPTFNSSKLLGASSAIPYFYDINYDKDLTITPKIFTEHNPLFLTEYRQAFKDSRLHIDTSYTKGLKKKTSKTKLGERSHFFLNFFKTSKKDNRDNEIKFNIESASNKKYLKTYKIETNLVDYNKNVFENYFSFTSNSEDDFFGLETQAFKDVRDNKLDRYEYITPSVTYSKNLTNFKNLGSGNITSNFKIENYETNKTNKSFINDLTWDLRSFLFNNGIKSRVLSEFKNVNYEAKNIPGLKTEKSSEIYGAIGHFSELKLLKNYSNNHRHFFTPKFLLRYAPGNMKKETDGDRIDPSNIFSLNRVSSEDNFESGLNATLGFEYEIQKNKNSFLFTGGQIINNKENKKMSSETSLDEKLSDFVASSTFNFNDKVNLNYNFSLDENYKKVNYNDFQSTLNFNMFSMNFNYLKESEHYGENEYIESQLNFMANKNKIISLKGKRNLITNSSDYYDLSYEYFNDCLRAGIVYRREFYNDSEIDPENTLMFKITLVPFGDLASQSIDQ